MADAHLRHSENRRHARYFTVRFVRQRFLTQVEYLCYGGEVVTATGRREVLPADVVLIRETMSRMRGTP